LTIIHQKQNKTKTFGTIFLGNLLIYFIFKTFWLLIQQENNMIVLKLSQSSSMPMGWTKKCALMAWILQHLKPNFFLAKM
jgi:hypothetical protein